MIIDNETGELLEENKENYMIAKKELGELEIFGDWIEKQEQLLMAKEQFDMVDKPFRRILKELFEKYSIKRLENDYMDVILKNGYNKSSWNEEKLKAFIYAHGGNPDDFKDEKWINGAFQIKYKG